MNDAIAGAKREILAVIERSEVPEDYPHASNTLQWLLKLDPTADEAMQIAALAHDIDRAVTDRKVLRADYPDYDAFKGAHAKNSVTILREILDRHGVEQSIVRESCRLVCLHEIGGCPRSDLLKDADSISYFDVNLPLYFQREGWEETRRRCTWGYLRLSGRARAIVADLTYDKPLGELMNESIEAAALRDGRGSVAEQDIRNDRSTERRDA